MINGLSDLLKKNNTLEIISERRHYASSTEEKISSSQVYFVVFNGVNLPLIYVVC